MVEFTIFSFISSFFEISVMFCYFSFGDTVVIKEFAKNGLTLNGNEGDEL
jgi:hypothetical protein